MTDYETIRAPAEAVKAARAEKREDETWGDFLQRCADAEPVVEMTESDVRRIVRDEFESLMRDVQGASFR